jgi:hypothetical protein
MASSLVVRVTPRATSSPDRTEHGLHRSGAHARRWTYIMPTQEKRRPVLGELASDRGASIDYRDPQSVNYFDHSHPQPDTVPGSQSRCQKPAPIRAENRDNSLEIQGTGATAPVSACSQSSQASNDSTDKPLNQPRTVTCQEFLTRCVHSLYVLRRPGKSGSSQITNSRVDNSYVELSWPSLWPR